MADEVHQEPQRLNLGQHLQLGGGWSPAPMGWQWLKIDKPHPDAPQLWVLRIETVIGVFGFSLSDEDMRKFVQTAMDQTMGIVLPSTAELAKFDRPG